MKKHFAIQSIRRDARPSDREGWMDYTITPITVALQYLPKAVDEYNEGEKKLITYNVYGVNGKETAVITIRGPRTRVNGFTTALAETNFYEYFSLRETTYPEIYL